MSAAVVLAIVVGAGLAFANGGNDQFKGVATLYGSGVMSYRKALLWATLSAAIGAVGVIWFGGGLIAAFSGKGLVPPAVVSMRAYPLAVGLGAAATVLLATLLEFPISTTHALMGGLVGVGLIASPAGVNWSQLGEGFFLPMLTSPLLSGIAVLALYPIAHRVRRRAGVSRDTCVCIGEQSVVIADATSPALAVATAHQQLGLTVASQAVCTERYQGAMLGVQVGPVIDALHALSAGAVCLARATNDVPKMAAVFLIGGALSPTAAIAGVTAAMLVGGLLQSARIAETMGRNTTTMNPGQGCVANIVTSLIVLFASKLGVPVSTTHVACGSLFGLGAANGGLKKDMFGKILLAWVVTLPLGAALSALIFLLLRGVV